MTPADRPLPDANPLPQPTPQPGGRDPSHLGPGSSDPQASSRPAPSPLRKPHNSSALGGLRSTLWLALALALLPAALFLLMDAYLIQQKVRAEAATELERLTHLVADAYGQRIDEAERLLATVAQFPEVQTGDPAACSQRLADLVALYGNEHPGIGVADREGVMFCISQPVTTTVRIGDRLWYREALRTGEFAIGEYAISRPLGIPALGLGYPVLDARGAVTRVVALNLRLALLQRETAELPLPPDAVLAVTDHNGTILARTPDGEQWVGQSQAPALLAQMQAQGTGVFETAGIDGTPRLYGFTPVRGPGETQVWLSIGRTPGVVYAEVREGIARDVVSILTVLLAALVALWLVGSGLLRRIDQLVAASQALAGGNWRARAPVRPKGDELDQLGQAFNEMAAALEQRAAERAAAESALREAHEQLEQRVRERTAELERSNRELNQFAYVASHDLKAPLRAIDNLATWISQDAAGVLPTQSAEHLVKLRGRVRRMETLLEDLLAYSRAGRVRPASETVKVEQLVQDVVALLAPPEGFVIRVEGADMTLRTPRASLELVLRNLIGNAIKHHHGEVGEITVAAVERGNWVEFCVADDGPGIEPKYHTKIFDMFQTLQPRDQVEGSGMGLAIVKKLVESYGGEIRVESARGEGAAFCFTWPRRGVEPEAVKSVP